MFGMQKLMNIGSATLHTANDTGWDFGRNGKSTMAMRDMDMIQAMGGISLQEILEVSGFSGWARNQISKTWIGQKLDQFNRSIDAFGQKIGAGILTLMTMPFGKTTPTGVPGSSAEANGRIGIKSKEDQGRVVTDQNPEEKESDKLADKVNQKQITTYLKMTAQMYRLIVAETLDINH